MVKKEIYAIDARWIESTGVGAYIRMVMRSGLYSIAVGDETVIHRYFPDIKVIPFDAEVYGVKGILFFPIGKLKKENVTVLHSPNYNAPLFWNRKLIVTIHDLRHYKFPQYSRKGKVLMYMYEKYLLKKSIKRADKLCVVSQYVKNEIVESFKVRSEKLEITYNTVEECYVKKEDREVIYLYEKYNIPSESRIVLYVGNLQEHKNVKTLVEAFKRIRSSSMTLVLVGKAFDSNVKSQIGINKIIEDKVVLTGSIRQEELVDWYNVADVFVFPSFYEGFGIPPLEAMACGTPVICSNAASLPEVVGDAAILFDPGSVDELKDAIEHYLKLDDSEIRTMVDKGYKRVAYFKNMVEKCWELIQKV